VNDVILIATSHVEPEAAEMGGNRGHHVDRNMQKSASAPRSQAKRPPQRLEPMPEKGAKFEPFYIAGFASLAFGDGRVPPLDRRFDHKR
jgi:hypothetical protein